MRNNSDSTEIIEKLNTAQNSLEEMRKDYIKGLFVRTKLKWVEQGEKPTKYFLSLERRNFINKTVNKLVDSNGETITSQAQILSEIEKFYKNLYSCCDDKLQAVDLDTIINKNDIRVLDDIKSSNLEGCITYEEALSALKKNEK